MIDRHTTPKNTFEAKNSYKAELLPISTIKIDPKHPRKTTPKQINKAAAFMAIAAWVPPIIIDQDNYVLVGQEWFEAAKELGMENVQVLVVDGLSEPQRRAFRIAYARILADGGWDYKQLAIEFEYIIEMELTCDLGFSAEITGFEAAEIDVCLSGVTGDEEDPADQIPDPPKVPISKLGDLWLLGKHRVICGDALDPEIYKKLMGGEPIQLVCSDVPYNVPIKGFVSGNGAVKHEDFSMASGEMSVSEFIEFLRTSFENSAETLDEGGCLYIFIDWRHVEEVLAAARQCALILLNICCWVKNVGGMGAFYRSQHEFVIVLRKGKKSHRNNILLGKYGRNRSNVWNYPSANMSKEGRKALKDHPTPKPVAMIADIIKDVTKTNELVLDPFLGGGTTIISAEKTRRRCYGIELDPKYVDVTIRRWKELFSHRVSNR